ncbi:hypothetical protein C8Q79DRAFT_103492 [Trametes meyenii]|nr:hypothetical protein C8Q79DRAFT_103492 [Trametes meyenii]
MRLSFLLCTAALVGTATSAALGRSAVSSMVLRRGLDDFIDGLKDKDQTTGAVPTSTREHTDNGAVQTTTRLPDGSDLRSFLGFSASSDSTSGRIKSKETASIPVGTSYSVIGTLPPIQTPTGTFSAGSPTTPSSIGGSGPSATTQSTGTAAATQSSASNGTSEWKIIGVAVIAFATVAGILLLSVFFDHWWRFIKDMFWHRRKAEMEEELVPDWEKAEWHLRCGRDRQRYPSFGSLPSDAMVQPPPAAVVGPTWNAEAGRAFRQPLGVIGNLESQSRRTCLESEIQGVGLGLGRVGSVRRDASPSSRIVAGPRSPSVEEKAVPGSRAQNPFEDTYTPMPEDVYGGVAN